MPEHPLLRRALGHASAFLESVSARHVGGTASAADLRSAFGGPLPEEGLEPERVLDDLVRWADPGIVASAGPRFFGFVVGGTLPTALAADWMVSTWDQDAGLYVLSPAAAIIEEVAAGWILDILGLPPTCSVGFVTGGQMASFTALAAARHAVLSRAGWDVEEEGLKACPPVRVIAGAEAHVTISRALRVLGLGSKCIVRVDADDQGRMRPDRLRQALSGQAGPTIVCAQAGHVNTGAFDPLAEIVRLTREAGAWLHVDGAFGLWAAASPTLRHHLTGFEGADSWSADGHKYLNAPYDCGIVIAKDPAAHRGALAASASYLQQTASERESLHWVPEFSRRARGVPVYAALRALGRSGVVALVERCVALARRAASALGEVPGVRILNNVVLNQVLVRFGGMDRDASDRLTRAVVARVQREGVCWLGGTRFHDLEAMRISVSGWSTTEGDIDRSVAAILDAARAEGLVSP